MRILAGMLLFAMVAVSRADDEVKLKNGDRLTGTVKSLSKGKLVMVTASTGEVKIDWSLVASVKIDAPTTKIQLTTGETLEGKVVPGAEGRLTVQSGGTVAPVEVEASKVAFINEPPTQWHGTLAASAKATDGNTHLRSFLIAGDAIRETELDQILVRAIFRYASDSGTLIERNAYGIGKYSYKLTPHLYAYVSEELLGDTFKDLTIGTITSIGLGYRILNEDWIDLSAEAGFAFITNDFRVAPDETHPGARISVRLVMKLPLGFELKETFTIYPNFDNSQDYTIRNEATLGTGLGGGWTLLGGVVTEYDNEPTPGFEKADNTYFVGLGYKF